MSQKIKYLFAIHRDSDGNLIRTKIAEGTTADFALVEGFVFENATINEENEAGSSELWDGISGLYPAMHAHFAQNLQGKLLTLCDATFTNKDQRESFKSIVKENIWTVQNGAENDLERKFPNSHPKEQ